MDRPAPVYSSHDDDRSRLFRELNERIVGDDRVVCVQLPVRDGVTIVRRV